MAIRTWISHQPPRENVILCRCSASCSPASAWCFRAGSKIHIYFLGDAYPMPIRCLSDGYPMPIRRLSDAYLTSIRWPIWRLSDGHPMFLIHIYYLSDGYPMPIWRLSGGIWWLPNVYWTPSTTYEMGIQWLSNGISFLIAGRGK